MNTKIVFQTFLFSMIILNFASAQSTLPLDSISLPPGFNISVYAENIPKARSLALGDRGTVFVGTKDDKVYALVDNDGDNRAETVYTLYRGLNTPNGVAFYNGDLYIGEINRIIKSPDIEDHLDAPLRPIIINSRFPAESHHGRKYLRFGPDGMLYLGVGVPCNICLNDNPLFGTIMRLNPDGSGLEIFARGVRNTVGIDFNPEDGSLWFTDNGRDGLGDDIPPDELNHAPAPGMDFGFPYVYGNNIPNPEFRNRQPSDAEERFTPTARDLGPHVAALGMRFYDGNLFPEEYENSIFIAEHGSWNRSVPIGYRITRVKLEGNRPVLYETFAEGWLRPSGSNWGRPVDILVLEDGSLLVSDDKAGAIYRISYNSQ